MKVWVGGTFGDTPTVVATSLERAMMKTVMRHRAPYSIQETGYPEQWICSFLDGEPGDIRCTITMADGGETVQLYLEQFDIEEETDDPMGCP